MHKTQRDLIVNSLENTITDLENLLPAIEIKLHELHMLTNTLILLKNKSKDMYDVHSQITNTIETTKGNLAMLGLNNKTYL